VFSRLILVIVCLPDCHTLMQYRMYLTVNSAQLLYHFHQLGRQT